MTDHREDDLVDPDRPGANDADDPDIDVLTDYCMGELSTADAEEFERRLREEDGLLERLWPALRLHYGNGPDIFRRARRERFPDEAAALDEIVKASGITPRGRKYPRFEKFLVTEPRRRKARVNVELGQLVGYLAAACVVIAALIGGGRFAYRNVGRVESAKTAWTLAHRGVRNTTRFEWGETLPNGPDVVLAPGSSMRSDTAPWSSGYAVMLEGSARVKMGETSRPIAFVTAAGEAFVMPGGEYQIATEDSTAMEVTVKRGMALARGGGTKDENYEHWVTLGAGQHARVTRGTRVTTRTK